MIRTFFVVMLLLLAACAGTISPVGQQRVVISNDRGGYINAYLDKYRRWAAQNKLVVIDGYCASSCTTFFSAIPASNVCVTRRAVLGFHGAWKYCGQCEYPEETHLMTDTYPQGIKDWIKAHGGVSSYKTMRLMRWPETKDYFNVCP